MKGEKSGHRQKI